ncbi:hypothetical protein BN2475_60010 [Paraburkholderia ribeironis]|uniref:Uncharacterized protein n=1 Tax=Paraburkholderia ribeironis TaxID=1247936 RepID=A0A1N7RLF2_9BURK|nr:hypothetical protein BN2475_60010 [Paraburkholderia ribeironis]
MSYLDISKLFNTIHKHRPVLMDLEPTLMDMRNGQTHGGPDIRLDESCLSIADRPDWADSDQKDRSTSRNTEDARGVGYAEP